MAKHIDIREEGVVLVVVVLKSNEHDRFHPTFDEYLADIKTYGPTASFVVHPVQYSDHEKTAAVIVAGSATASAFSTEKVSEFKVLGRGNSMTTGSDDDDDNVLGGWTW